MANARFFSIYLMGAGLALACAQGQAATPGDWKALDTNTVPDQLRALGITVGPGMSADMDAALIGKWFFSRIKLDYPALEKVRDLVARLQYAEALEAYRDVLVDRLAKLYLGGGRGAANNAERLLKHMLVSRDSKGELVYLDIGAPGAVNWYPDPGSANWGEHLGFMLWTSDLATAFSNNQDKRGLNPEYWRLWAGYWEDFALNHRRQWAAACAANPKRTDLGSYYPLWLGIRAGIFVTDLGLFAATAPELTKTNFPGKQLAILLTANVEWPLNVVVDCKFNAAPGNQGIQVNTDMAKAILAFPELRNAEVWRESVREQMGEHLRWLTMFRDGTDREPSFNYNLSVGNAWAEMARILAQDPGSQDLASEIQTAAVARFRALAVLMRPGSINAQNLLPNLCLCGDGNQTLERPVRPLADPLMDQIDAHVYSNGPAPAFTSIYLPYGGYAVMRSGWRGDAGYLFFRNSRLPNGHYHRDYLGLQMTAFGRTMLIDSGPDNYSPEFDNDYLNSSFAHNTIVVDNMDQNVHYSVERQYNNEPIQMRWHTSAHFDLAGGAWLGGYGGWKEYCRIPPTISDVVHRRQVLFLRRPGLWIVTDTMESTNTHRYAQIWNFASAYSNEQVVVDNARQQVWTTDPAGPNVFLYQFAPVPLNYARFYGQEKPEARGWYKKHYGNVPVPKVDLHAVWQGTGDQSLLTIIAPAKGTNSIVKRAKKLEQNGAAGFEAELADGALVTYLTSPTIQKLSAGAVTIMGRRLLAVQESSGLLRGIALKCKSFYSAGRLQTINAGNPVLARGFSFTRWRRQSQMSRVNDFEFEIQDNKLVQTTPICIPAGFRWKETPQGFGPDYRWGFAAINPTNTIFVGRTKLILSYPFPDVDLRYTLDGTEPTRDSRPYRGPIELTRSTVVSVRPFFGVEMLPGPVSSRTYKCWISKAASYTLAGDTRPQNPALLNGEGYKTPFAFTSLEMESPHIIIDLGRTYRVDEIQVENRADAPKNISLLTAWISADGREWEKIGYTDNFQTQWSVMLGQTPKARYVKIGFSGKSVLQLRQVKIFGADQPDFFSWINNISRSLRTK